jgi:hypothetical protein
MTAVRARSKAADAVLAEAAELALDAAVEEAGSAAFVGEALGISAEDDRVVMHRFACRLPAYQGWYWAVVLTRAPRSKVVTVDEVVLLPGDGSMLAPDWVPWSDRIQAGDLGVGDLLPTAADDVRLVLRAADVEELSDDLPFFELGLGRARVLSLDGREQAATRWYEGEPGPSAPISRSAPAQCGTCGFYVRLIGGLGRLFGVCANEFAPDDASVVADDHGCGAHSEALVLPSAHPQPVPFDDDAFETLEPEPATDEAAAPAAADPTDSTEPITPETPTAPEVPIAPEIVHDPGAVERAEAVAGTDGEPYGHS